MQRDLLSWHQKLCGEAVGLLLRNLPTRFGIVVHNQVPDLVGDIEALSVVVLFHRIEHDNRARAGV